MSHAAHRPPSRRRLRLVPVLAVLALVAVLVTSGWWASSSLRDDDDASAGRARGGSKLSAGVEVWEEMDRIRGLTTVAGARLQSSAHDLSDDSDVRAATLALAWQATCGVIQGEVQFEADSVARSVLDLAGPLGVSFRDDGERVLVDAVLAVVRDSASDVAAKCGDIRAAGF